MYRSSAAKQQVDQQRLKPVIALYVQCMLEKVQPSTLG